MGVAPAAVAVSPVHEQHCTARPTSASAGAASVGMLLSTWLGSSRLSSEILPRLKSLSRTERLPECPLPWSHRLVLSVRTICSVIERLRASLMVPRQLSGASCCFASWRRQSKTELRLTTPRRRPGEGAGRAWGLPFIACRATGGRSSCCAAPSCLPRRHRKFLARPQDLQVRVRHVPSSKETAEGHRALNRGIALHHFVSERLTPCVNMRDPA